MSARANQQPRKLRRWWRRLYSVLLWYLVPCLVGCAALAYIYGAVVWHVNPPVVAVEGTSMLPTLRTGEIVFLAPADPSTLKTGDIIAVRVPTQDRTTYSLPANVVHRIVRVEHTKSGLLFITKGDNNSGNDVFTTPAANVVGRLRYVVPGIGFVFLFIQSPQGEIFFASVALIGLLYYLYGVFDDRRAVAQNTMESTVQTMQAVLAEAKKFEQRAAVYQEPRGVVPPSTAHDQVVIPDSAPAQQVPVSRAPEPEFASSMVEVPSLDVTPLASEPSHVGVVYIPSNAQPKHKDEKSDGGKAKRKSKKNKNKNKKK